MRVQNGMKKKNRGFSMVELIIAFSILAIIVGIVGFMMTTSSRTYSRLSIESQLQSEAQLVANSISELAIDSMDAGNKVLPSYTCDVDASTDNKIVLLSRNRSVDKRYQIVHDNTTKELYLIESDFNDSTKTYGPETKSLLGQNIDNIKVDLSRVKKENILSFDLTYKKNDRSYTGNYQVLMRNRAYADPESLNPDPIESKMTMLDLTPKIVYIDIKNNTAVQYYKDSLATEPFSLAGGNSIEFTATPSYVGSLGNMNSTWSLLNHDSKIFSLSATESTKSSLTWGVTTGYTFKDTPNTEFKVIATKDNFKKAASIRLRMVKSIDITPQKGITAWKSEYSGINYSGHEAANADGYAQPNGTVTVYANVNSTNVKTGLNWRLYRKRSDGTGEWEQCDEDYCKVLSAQTSGYTNTITLGKYATNDMEFKLEARSVFDDSVFDEYIFGVAPTRAGKGGGFNSRGYRTNMADYFKKYPKLDKNSNEEWKEVSKLNNITFRNGDNYDKDTETNKVFKWDSTTQTLYIDYESFQYTGEQRKQFYKDFIIYLVVDYVGKDGANHTLNCEYPIYGVNVGVTAGGNQTICVQRGGSGSLEVTTKYYNLTNRKLFGIYAKEYGESDFTDNLNREGHEDTDKYLTIKTTSPYGDINNYVDNISISVEAKKKSNLDYPIEPITVRTTVDDFYQVSKHTDAMAYQDFNVYIANVENQGVYLPVPGVNKGFPSYVPDSSNKAKIEGIDTANRVAVGYVYQSGKKIMCDYGAHTYMFDPTYHYWKEI